MKRLCVCVGLLVFASLLPTAASAGPITVDPIIGVRGGMFGSHDPSEGTLTFTDGCPEGSEIASVFSCLILDVSHLAAGGLSSLLVQITDGDGNTALEFQNDNGESCGFEEEGCRGSDFGLSTFTSGDYPQPLPAGQVRLFGDALFCGDVACVDAVLYIRPLVGEIGNFTARTLEVNGTPINPVPEPASLLLMGTGIATLAGRRLRRKNS
jgi:hypothetical protein